MQFVAYLISDHSNEDINPWGYHCQLKQLTQDKVFFQNLVIRQQNERAETLHISTNYGKPYKRPN